MMKRFGLGAAFLIAVWLILHEGMNGQPLAKDAKSEEEVRAVFRGLRDAAAQRDRAAFESLIADGFTFIHSNGATDTKKTYIDKAAAGAFSIQQAGAKVDVLDEQLSVYAKGTAVWISRSVLRSKSQDAAVPLRSVAVYAKIHGRWRWVFGQSSPLPVRPKAAAVDRRIYESYVGQYEISPGRTFTVVKEGDSLQAVTTNRQPGELIPKSETEFIWFNPDVNLDAQVVFIKDENGKVSNVAFRVNGQETWRAKRVQ